MKFLVPNYSCLQNSWLGGLPSPDPHSLCPLSSTEFVEPPPRNKTPGYTTVNKCPKFLAGPSLLYANSTVVWDTIKYTSCISVGCWDIAEIKSRQELGNLATWCCVGGWNRAYFECYIGECWEITWYVMIRGQRSQHQQLWPADGRAAVSRMSRWYWSFFRVRLILNTAPLHWTPPTFCTFCLVTIGRETLLSVCNVCLLDHLDLRRQ